MTGFNEHNLPADFDDLSKHAPLLEKIRAKGDGYVVPENYFSDSAELSVAGCQLSVVGKENPGFTVPENYFEELAERIIAIVNLSTTDDRQPTTDCGKPTTVPFEIPADYFNELNETIRTKLSLDNLKQDEGFFIPGNYFEKFADKILTQVAVDEPGKGSDTDVPTGYFDTLADRISSRISEEEDIEPIKAAERGRIIVFADVLKRYARPVSAAASVTLLIAVSIWFFNRKETKVEIAKVNPQQNIQPVIPAPKKDSATTVIQPQDNIAIQPKNNKKQKRINQDQQPVVKEVSSQDVLEQLYLLDENMVADYITDQNPEFVSTPQEESLNEEMLNYLLDNDADPSDINK